MTGRIAVLGGGAWGIALARLAARAGRPTVLWTIEPDRLEHYLPGARLPETLPVTSDLAAALAGARIAIFAVPVRVVREVAASARLLLGDAIRISAAKGFEPGTSRRPSEILAEAAPGGPVVVLSGPSHAEEVAADLPTTVVAASADGAAGRVAQEALTTAVFRVYRSVDLIGVETGGALKNPIAIAAGAAAGLGLGDNALGALVARGLAEMTRLAVALGADPPTLAGLAGAGDLVATCVSRHSRNRRFGLALARGIGAEEALQEVGATVEGAGTAAEACRLAAACGVEMPITDAVRRVVEGTLDVRRAVEALMTRPPRDERDGSADT